MVTPSWYDDPPGASKMFRRSAREERVTIVDMTYLQKNRFVQPTDKNSVVQKLAYILPITTNGRRSFVSERERLVGIRYTHAAVEDGKLPREEPYTSSGTFSGLKGWRLISYCTY